jgi:hypothetical protein
MLAFLRKVLQRKQERSRICSFVADRCSKPPQELEHKLAEDVRIATLDEGRSKRGLLNCWAGAREKPASYLAGFYLAGFSDFKV